MHSHQMLTARGFSAAALRGLIDWATTRWGRTSTSCHRTVAPARTTACSTPTVWTWCGRKTCEHHAASAAQRPGVRNSIWHGGYEDRGGQR